MDVLIHTQPFTRNSFVNPFCFIWNGELEQK